MIREYSKGQHIWRALWPALAFMGIQLVASALAMIGLAVYYSVLVAQGYTGLGMVDPVTAAAEAVLANILLVLLISSVISLVFYYFMWRATRKTHTELNTGEIGVSAVLMVSGMFIGLNLLLISVMDVTHVMEYFPEHAELMESMRAGGGIILQLLVIGVLVPIVEELCFRGVILNRLAAWTPRWVAVAVSSLLFGIIHLNVLQGLYATIVGVLLGWVYIRTRNLWAPIIGHIAFNSINIGLGHYFEVMEWGWPSMMAIIPMAILAGLCAVMLHIHTKNIDECNIGEFE